MKRHVVKLLALSIIASSAVAAPAMAQKQTPPAPPSQSWFDTIPPTPAQQRQPRPELDGLEVYNGVYTRAEPQVWTDPQNGCQYIIIDRGDRITMTPRLDPQGKPICRA